ncbi:pyridoxamine kinase [Alloiococcus sp. CFN-8]|uniref:pyridoxamine kinase n=1 Tax=Alloiococcus sp. CFN-8 TaxID=3416081 RepID=UPI003CF3E5A2
MKRIVTVQDISCVGKCSLTVALPVISAMGVETSVIPTAVLSTHTAFKDFTFRDLTDDIEGIAEHWKKEKIAFDAIYTGYLGSFKQLKLVSNFFDDFKEDNTLIFVDPVMGDYGKLYTGFTQEFAFEMAKLCSKADIIVPNMTEASYMLGIDYIGEGYSQEYVKDILLKLSALGPKQVVLTGVSFEPNILGVMGYDSATNKYFSYFNEKINVNFHGTGDVFASCCVGALMNGYSLEDSLKIAADFTVESIRKSIEDKDSRWYGVNFESAVPYLIKRIEK